jgi:hypothetical protein
MVAIWVWILFSLILLGVSVTSGASAWEIYRLRRHGIRTDAQVSGFRYTKDADSDPRHHVRVIFCLPDGTEVEAESMTSNPDGSNDLLPGHTMNIVYDPAKPSRICVTSFEEHRLRARDAVAYAVVAVALAFGAAVTVAQAFTG